MAVFSSIIQQKRVLDAGELFPSSHVRNDRPFHGQNNMLRQGRTSSFIIIEKFSLVKQI